MITDRLQEVLARRRVQAFDADELLVDLSPEVAHYGTYLHLLLQILNLRSARERARALVLESARGERALRRRRRIFNGFGEEIDLGIWGGDIKGISGARQGRDRLLR